MRETYGSGGVRGHCTRHGTARTNPDQIGHGTKLDPPQINLVVVFAVVPCAVRMDVRSVGLVPAFDRYGDRIHQRSVEDVARPMRGEPVRRWVG